MKNRFKMLLRKYPVLYTIFASIGHIFTYVLFILFKFMSIPFMFFTPKKRIVISNYKGQGVYDNPKYIVEYLLREYPNLNVIWLVNDVKKTELLHKELKNVKFYKNTFFNQLYYLSTSKVWVDNSRKVFFPIKKNQIYIQIWHGGLGLKKVEKALDNLTLIHRFNAIQDSSHTDIMISNSNHLSKIYRNDFQFKGPIMKLGYPMNDILFINKNYEQVTEKEIFNVLYVPTFRGDEIQKKIPNYFPDISKIINKLNKSGLNVRFILRPHPSINMNINELFPNNERIVDGSIEPDIKKLITSADMVISDYSSAIFDCVITQTPGIIYAKDYQLYKDKQGLYYELEELPFPFSFDDDELIEKILRFDENKYKDKCSTFAKQMGLVDDGAASERVCKLINDLITEGKEILDEDYWSSWIE